MIEKALALDASLAGAHYELGRLLLKQGKASEALHHLETATKLDPVNPSVPIALANAYWMLGRNADQAKELKRYRELEQREVR